MANEARATLRETPLLTVIDLRGEVTTFADDAINSAYRQVSERGAKNILLNFSGVDHLNSAGIAIIIGVLTETRKADQCLLITGLTPHYRKVFHIMGLARYVPIFDSEDAARQSIDSR
ncbi:MAG: STAS domain-containing protein [Chloroflexi bacterium]|nr:STAS domain-containing protein [Chloroflexota bacterium]